MKKKNSFANLVLSLFYTEKDKKIVGLIDNANMETLHAIAVVAAYAEIISLVIFLFFTFPSSPEKVTGVFSVSFCIVLVTLIAILTRKLYEGYKKTRTISHVKATLLIVIFYTVLSIWGILVDIKHYKLGEQMLTFYIVQFCFLSFLTIVPKLGDFLILGMFIALFVPAFKFDGGQFIQPNNHFVFAILAVFANAIQYTRAIERHKARIGISELNKTLQERSITDDLTKLKNRYALRMEFDKYLGKNIFVTMIDIDFFKTVNDTYGHLVGDEILQIVSQKLKEVFENADIYRYGGDEFLIIVQDYTQEKYEQKLATFNDVIAAIRIPKVDVQIACSSGYSNGTPAVSDDYRKLLKEADDKLYELKKARK